jgi:hypothetical protein
MVNNDEDSIDKLMPIIDSVQCLKRYLLNIL